MLENSKGKKIVFNIVKTLILPVFVCLLFFLLTGGKYGTLSSVTATLRNTIMPVLIAWGAMFILAANMWDFSSGAAMYVVAIIGGKFVNMFELNMLELVISMVLVNMILMAIVGGIYTVVRAPSMVISLAFAMIFESVCKVIFEGNGVTIAGETTKLAVSPYCYMILGAAFLLTYVLWKYTKFAYSVRALGAGEQVARNIGLNPQLIRFRVFVVEGIYLGMASAIMLTTKSTVRPPTNLSSFTMVFDALMAVFIGIYLEKYSNRIISIGVGAFVMRMINSGLLAMGVNSALQIAITGVFLALLIGISTNQQRIADFFADKKRAQKADLEYRNSQ